MAHGGKKRQGTDLGPLTKAPSPTWEFCFQNSLHRPEECSLLKKGSRPFCFLSRKPLAAQGWVGWRCDSRGTGKGFDSRLTFWPKRGPRAPSVLFILDLTPKGSQGKRPERPVTVGRLAPPRRRPTAHSHAWLGNFLRRLSWRVQQPPQPPNPNPDASPPTLHPQSLRVAPRIKSRLLGMV